MQEQSPSKLLQARDMLYELLTHCIPADVILSTLTRELTVGRLSLPRLISSDLNIVLYCDQRALDDTLKHEVVYWAAYYDHRFSLHVPSAHHIAI